MAQSTSMEIQPVIASINSEDQNTQKEADIPGGNEKINDEFVIEIRKMFERPEIQLSKQCRIYKFPHRLRKWNEEAYTPQVISIGPIHHQNENLIAMEEHKERFFRRFVEWRKIKLEYLVGTIREMEKSIRGCYSDTIDLSSDMFVKMIMVDACFILELFIRSSSGDSTSDNRMLEQPRDAAIFLDLLLIENQLPFFVIEKLHQLAFPSLSGFSSYNALLKCSRTYFMQHSTHFQFRQDLPSVEIVHFTDLLRTSWLPPLEKRPKRGRPLKGLLYTATQLREAGVKFESVKSTECHFDIKFEKGVLKIPELQLDDVTEVVNRNIMALEQTCYKEDAYFTDYIIFIDSLINTREDVDLLCKKKILVNYLGDNNAAMSMINNSNKGIIWNTTRNDYSDLYQKLNKFYENPWHKWRATLRHEYFNTPWRGASTVAAIILLVLTFIQTVYSINK